MKEKLTADKWWDEIVECEMRAEIAFASARALPEARMSAEMDNARARRNGGSCRRNLAAR